MNLLNVKYITKGLCLSILFLGISCSNFLEEDPKGSLTPDNFFKTEEDLNLAVNAIYSNLAGMFNQYGTLAPMMGGDDVTTLPAGNKEGFRQFDIFQGSDGNDRMAAMWDFSYKTVRASNNLILNFEKGAASEEVKKKSVGQAYFLRAMAYFFLVRLWGNIPLITSTEINLEIEKSTPEQVYAVIVEDLKKAEELLPERWPSAPQKGVSATQGSAKALLANVYLTMAGWPLKDVSKYALAAEKAKEVIDNKDLYGYSLIPVKDLWKESNNFNSETVFGAFYNNNLGVWPQGNMSAPRASQPGEENGWDDVFAEINFFKDFPEGPRKDATFQTKIAKSKNDDGTLKYIDWTESLSKHPYYKKMRDGGGYKESDPFNTDWWSTRTVMIIRYAEVLLTYAEAKAMASGPDGTAYDAINQVRKRAGLENLSGGLSAEKFKEAVVAERGWEFAGLEPAARWFDLTRNEMVESVAAQRHPNEIPLPAPPTKEDYYAPIPVGDKLINRNL